MSESNFLPVRPNINGDNTPSQKDRGIFANNKDSDIQQFINNKKMNALSIDSPKTKEEIRVSRKEQQKSAQDNASKNESDDSKSKLDGSTPVGVSWVIIGLAVVIIILILIIVYYVVNHNNIASPAPLIPESIMKPTAAKAKITSVEDNVATSDNQVVKPITVTKNELDAVLNRLQTIPEVEEPVESVTGIVEIDVDNEHHQDDNTKMEEDMDSIIESKFEELSKMSYNVDEMDMEVIEDFKSQAMSDD